MKSQWIVVANAARARLFRRAGPDAPLISMATLEHPESRLRGSQLADDRPGREAVDGSPGGTRFEPREDPRRKEHRHFAREVAARLDDVLAEGELASLWICASDPFLGELKATLSDPVRQHLAVAASHDWTACDIAELEQRLRELHARA
jgi:protein required for attachment to host cells